MSFLLKWNLLWTYCRCKLQSANKEIFFYLEKNLLCFTRFRECSFQLGFVLNLGNRFIHNKCVVLIGIYYNNNNCHNGKLNSKGLFSFMPNFCLEILITEKIRTKIIILTLESWSSQRSVMQDQVVIFHFPNELFDCP